ncbi:hypothetical protein RNZ50_10030 [Paracoccaceae bacterium Fryx2]|nr:hypothetical protein [Paracoccaceae bacterium Fryx2]
MQDGTDGYPEVPIGGDGGPGVPVLPAIRVADMKGSGVNEVRVDPAGVRGIVAGEVAADTVTLSDGNKGSFVDVFGTGSTILVSGLATFTTIENAEAGDALRFAAKGSDHKSPLAAAMRYALTRMERLRPYLGYGILALDTDVVEQPLSQPSCGFGGLSRQHSHWEHCGELHH